MSEKPKFEDLQEISNVSEKPTKPRAKTPKKRIAEMMRQLKEEEAAAQDVEKQQIELPEGFAESLEKYSIDNKSEDVWEKPESDVKEAVSKRAGGVDNKAKVEDALRKANEKDILSGERKVRQPNPEDLEGVVFNEDGTEERDDLYDLEPDLRNYDKANEKKSEESVEEVESRELKAEDIEKANSIDELLEIIDASEGIQGASEYFDKDKLKMIIKMLQNKESYDGQEIVIEHVTRSGGLRQKVFELLQSENVEEPEVEEKVEQEEVVPAEEEIEKANEEEEIDDDENVFRVPGEKKEFDLADLPDLDNLPEVPGVSEANEKPIVATDDSFENSEVGQEYNKDIEALEKELVEERSKFVLAHKELSEQEEKMKRNPFKKFAMKALGWGAKENQIILDKNEQVRAAYEKKFLQLVKEKALKETDRILSLHANSKERKQYEAVTNKDIQEFISENEDLRETLETYDAYEGVTLSTLLSALKGVSKEKKEEYRTRFIYRKVLKDLNPAMIKNEDTVVENLLTQKI